MCDSPVMNCPSVPIKVIMGQKKKKKQEQKIAYAKGNYKSHVLLQGYLCLPTNRLVAVDGVDGVTGVKPQHRLC